jgi:AbrB family looped-hinge helix DNA binding protein
MDTATLSTKGQLVIPTRFRKALHLQPGDKVAFQLEGDKLVLKREEAPRAKLVMGEFGRRVLDAPPGAPEMTVELIRSLRDDD